MNIIKKIFNAIITIIIIVLLVIIISIGYSKYIKNDAISNLFGYTYLTVKSNSMYPEFEVNDIVIIKLGKEYKTKDIITFYVDNAIVTHRVEKIDGDKIITKGDSNNISDTPIDKKDVIGVVVRIIRK